jgi:tRNA (guanine-N7-)-methyltransferase
MTSNNNDPTDGDDRKQRAIRSFVLRAGRLTAGQQRAMEELWPLYGISAEAQTLDFSSLFPESGPVTVEIGFGNGENLIAMARNAPTDNFLGIEVHEPGVGRCLLGIEKYELHNVRVLQEDAVTVLQNNILAQSLNRINLFFPDPWHKKRHHKRRIVQPSFITLLAQKLTLGGMFHVATDWPEYAEHIQKVMCSFEDFAELSDFPTDRIKTRFDERGTRLGHTNWERAWCTRSKE